MLVLDVLRGAPFRLECLFIPAMEQTPCVSAARPFLKRLQAAFGDDAHQAKVLPNCEPEQSLPRSAFRSPLSPSIDAFPSIIKSDRDEFSTFAKAVVDGFVDVSLGHIARYKRLGRHLLEQGRTESLRGGGLSDEPSNAVFHLPKLRDALSQVRYSWHWSKLLKNLIQRPQSRVWKGPPDELSVFAAITHDAKKLLHREALFLWWRFLRAASATADPFKPALHMSARFRVKNQHMRAAQSAGE